MIISEDHILQEELKDLTCILLARAYPLQSLLNRVPCVPACERGLRANVMIACHLGLRANVPACQRAESVPSSHFSRANVPKNVPTCQRACQFFNLLCQRAKERANFSNIPLTKC